MEAATHTVEWSAHAIYPPKSSSNSPIGERLYAAHAHYGQAIADFCERAVRMGQFVDRGEPWDMANGM